jgi:sigma-B regulation protein RsbU (phosphoserine phosphatase)
MVQPTVDDQKALIIETAARLVGGQADLWLDEVLYWLPGSDKSLSPSAEPPSDLMRRAFEIQQISYADVVGHDVQIIPAVALPLHSRDTVLGVLEVKRPDGPPFSEEEIDLLDDLVIQACVALQAAQRVAVERWRIEQLSLVRQVSAQVTGVFDLTELARRVTDLILHTFRYYYTALFILRPGQDTLQMEASASRSNGGDGASSLIQVRLGDGIIGHVAQTGTEILANDVNHEPRYRYVEILPKTQSEVALPLKIENRVLGVLDVQSDQMNAFDETNLLVLRALADNIAMAVEHARLYGDLRRRADHLTAVADVSRAVASILDIDALLEAVVRLISTQFSYPSVYLFTVDPARQQIVYRAGIGPRLELPQGEALTCTLDESGGIVPWVACRGETVLANAVSDDPRFQSTGLLSSDACAELTVPLTFGDEVLGVLDVQSDRRDAFGDEDRFLFEALADNVATAIRNANLYRSEKWRRQVSDSLREVAGLLSADVALDQELDAILVELERTLPCDISAIWFLRGDRLCLSAVSGLGQELPASECVADADAWLSQALDAGEPVIRTPQSVPDPLGSALGFPPDYSAIAAPLRARDRRLGVLMLAHRSPGRYGAESRMITTAFASYAAVAIENTRLYQEAQELARISTVMLQVAEATRSLTTLDRVLETVVHLVPTLVGMERCAILLWDEYTAGFAPTAAYGLDAAQRAAFGRWDIPLGNRSAFDDLLQNKAPVFIYDVATDPRMPDLVAWELGFESRLLLPLMAQDEVLGTMLMDYRSDWYESGTAATIHDERLVIIHGVALQTAAAIENTKLRERQQEEAYVSAALLQVAQAVANLNSLDDILGVIVRIMPILVGVERCIVFLWSEAESAFYPAQVYGVSRDAQSALLARYYVSGEFPLLDNARERDCQLSHTLDSDKNELSEHAMSQVPREFVTYFAPVEAQRERPHSLLAVPLSVKGDVLGVMVLKESGAAHRSRDRWLEIINGIAHQAALAVQSDLLQQEMAERERLERELQLAHEIQQTFMPNRWLGSPGWDLAFTWRAARQVAGDFYDFFELPDGRLGLVIADVADKGMPAALFMALTRTLVRAASLEETSPADVMARVNDLLVPDAHAGMFVTAIYAVLSLETGELAYANAGHNLPLLLRSRTRELEQLERGGMALGVLEGIRLEEHSVFLEPGDYLIFYTDGVTEAFSVEGEIYGLERLCETVRKVGKPDLAQAVLDAIDNSVVDFVGDIALSDDLTLLVLYRQNR